MKSLPFPIEQNCQSFSPATLVGSGSFCFSPPRPRLVPGFARRSWPLTEKLKKERKQQRVETNVSRTVKKTRKETDHNNNEKKSRPLRASASAATVANPQGSHSLCCAPQSHAAQTQQTHIYLPTYPAIQLSIYLSIHLST